MLPSRLVSDGAPLLDDARLYQALEAIDAGDAARTIAPYLDDALYAGVGRLARTLKLGAHAARAVERAVPFDDGGFFVRSRVLLVHRPAPLVERLFSDAWPVHLLAFGPWGLRSLRGQRAFVEELLREQAFPSLRARGEVSGAIPYRMTPSFHERKDPSDMDPHRLASLCAEALGRRRGRSHLVLSASDEVDGYLRTLGQTQQPIPRYLSLNQADWDSLRRLVEPPAISGGPATGWTLTFVSLFGQNELRTQLTRQTVKIHADYTLTVSSEILSDPIIHEMYAVRGRPLLVAGASRVARVEPRPGWSD